MTDGSFPLLADEAERLLALARYDILHELPPAAFSGLAQVAARLLGTPIALLNFVADDATFTRACVGADLGQHDRRLSFCAYTIAHRDVLVIPDLRADPRFEAHPMVTPQGGVRFYAGAPLITPEGYAIGTLCVLDHRPHPPLSAEDRDLLRDLAALAVDELELRRRTLDLERQMQANALMLGELRRASKHAQTLLAVSALAELALDAPDLARHATELVARASSFDWVGLGTVQGDGMQGDILQVQSVWHAPTVPEALLASLTRSTRRGEGAAWQALHEERPSFVDEYAASPGARPELVAAGLRAAVFLPLGAFGDARFVLSAARLSPQPWSAADRDLLESAARAVTSALHRRAHLEAAERDALRDALTGLGNRRAFDRDLAAAVRGGQAFSLLLTDLDGFKGVNDRLGHAQGDLLLRQFAQALTLNGARAYRLGGDEFALLLAADPDRDPLLLQDEAFMSVDDAVAVLRSVGFGGVAASAGVALWPLDDPDPAGVVRLADKRMYAHKQRRAQASGQAAPAAADAAPVPPPVVRYGNVVLRVQTGALEVEGRRAQLSPKETQLLGVLAAFPERLSSREALLRAVWPDAPQRSNVLEVHLTNVRRKLEEVGANVSLRAVRGHGYALHLPGSTPGAAPPE